MRLDKPSGKTFEGLYSLINYFAERQEMLPKTHDQLYKYRRAFRVLLEEEKVIACGMLDLFTPELAEIKSLAVDPNHQKKGYGRILVEDCEKEARSLGIKKVFALTYQVEFFQKLGYKVVGMDALPEKVFRECNECPFKDSCNETAVIKSL